MKLSFDKALGAFGGLATLYAFAPLLVEVYQNGLSAFEGCKVAAQPLMVSLAAIVALYLKQSPIKKK